MAIHYLRLPSGGMFSGIEYVYVKDITLKTYWDYIYLIASLPNEEKEKFLLNLIIEGDKSIIDKLPVVDKEFILTRIYDNCFNSEISVAFNCPLCKQKIKETFVFSEYVVYYLDKEDEYLFTLNLNNKIVYLQLPLQNRFDDKYYLNYLHQKSYNEKFTEEEIDEIKYHIVSQINPNVGIQKIVDIVCNNCGFDFLINKVCGLELYNVNLNDIIEERKDFIKLLSYFCLMTHCSINDLLNLTYKEMLLLWNSIIEIKNKEIEEINKIQNNIK